MGVLQGLYRVYREWKRKWKLLNCLVFGLVPLGPRAKTEPAARKSFQVPKTDIVWAQAVRTYRW